MSARAAKGLTTPVSSPGCLTKNGHRWAQVARFLVITDKELNRIHREFIAERQRADLLSYSTVHRTWERANSKQRLTFGAGGILFLQGGYFLARFGGVLLCMHNELYYLKATAHLVSHNFP